MLARSLVRTLSSLAPRALGPPPPAVQLGLLQRHVAPLRPCSSSPPTDTQEAQQAQEDLSNLIYIEGQTGAPPRSPGEEKYMGGKGLGNPRGDLAIMFSCTVCDTRSMKKFSKHSYTKGVVIIECPGCRNKHIIADNLGWFSDMGEHNNIEKIMKAKGEEVVRMNFAKEHLDEMVQTGAIGKDGVVKDVDVEALKQQAKKE